MFWIRFLEFRSKHVITLFLKYLSGKLNRLEDLESRWLAVAIRVDSGLRDIPLDLEQIRCLSHRSIFNQMKYSASEVNFSLPRSMCGGDQCLVSKLEQVGEDQPLSTSVSVVGGSGLSSPLQWSGSLHCSILPASPMAPLYLGEGPSLSPASPVPISCGRKHPRE